MRLAVVLLVTIAILGLVDREIPQIINGRAATRNAIASGEETFGRKVNRRFLELRADRNAAIERAYRRWRSIPAARPAGEIRVALIGNSTTLFSVVPQVVEERLATQHPDRTVSVTPLVFAAIAVDAEQVLVRAALAKHADVIVLTPNLKGLVDQPPNLVTQRIRELFGTGGKRSADSGPASAVKRFLWRHWNLYRLRYDLRDLALAAVRRRLPRLDGASQQTRAVTEAFADIAAAAREGDLRKLITAYGRHRMGSLIGTPAFRRRLPPGSPVFSLIEETVDDVRRAGALGIAVFMPVNPVFRDARVTAGHERLHLDNTYTMALARRTLDIYHAGGFVTVNCLDALPASSFIDLVHTNGEGMRSFSAKLAAIVEAAVSDHRMVPDSCADL